MRFLLVFWLFLMPILLVSQTNKKRTATTIHKPSVQEYFSSNQLLPDSATTPYLYYQVYDWVGTRYKYSGESKKGIDCSGFVSKMYKDAYCINLAGASRDIWTTVAPIEKQELKEGDMVFFKIKKGQISHIGIYLGNNKFAHASVHSGVIVSDLEEEYYKKRFYKGGRIQETK